MSLISDELRQAVHQRAQGRCEYCHLAQEFQVATFPIDHINPRALNGPTVLDNLALACPRCNSRKWLLTEAADPLTGLATRLFNPRTDSWSEHFAWSGGDSLQLDARTPIGRATVALLDLNAETHVAVRRLLHALGHHPPAVDPMA